ncbi:MAG TPA: helix-turn-helix transcriptional regulator, partial [Chthoniobacterales bacterium]
MAPQGLSAFSSLLHQLYSATAVSFAEHLHQVLAQHFYYDVFHYEAPELIVSRLHPANRSRSPEPNGPGSNHGLRRQTRALDAGDVQPAPKPSAIDAGHVFASRIQPRRFETVILLTSDAEPRIILTRFNRGFSRSERAWMSLLGPHLGQLYRAARAADWPASPSAPSWHHAPTRRVMENALGKVERQGQGAPACLRLSALGPTPAEPRHSSALDHVGSNDPRFWAPPATPLPAVAAKFPSSSPDSTALEGLGLTVREAEVLLWVSRGKTNDEIAIILGISNRTVGKHMEHIASKLNVETRTSA